MLLKAMDSVPSVTAPSPLIMASGEISFFFFKRRRSECLETCLWRNKDDLKHVHDTDICSLFTFIRSYYFYSLISHTNSKQILMWFFWCDPCMLWGACGYEKHSLDNFMSEDIVSVTSAPADALVSGVTLIVVEMAAVALFKSSVSFLLV